MFTSTTVKLFDRFPEITAEIERVAKLGLDAAAVESAAVAQANASIDLKLEVRLSHGEVDGYSSGIKSLAKSSTPGDTTPIALFFDQGTLGNRRKPVKRPRKKTWPVKASTRAAEHSASRQSIESGEGIPAERFFGKSRAAGRKKLLAEIDRGLL